MSREPFEAMPNVMNAKQLAAALHISKSGTYNLLNSPDFPTLRIGGRQICYAIEVEKACIFKPYRHENRRGNTKPLPAMKKSVRTVHPQGIVKSYILL